MGFKVSKEVKRQILQGRLVELNQEGFVHQVNYLTADYIGATEEAENARQMCDTYLQAISFTEELLSKVEASDNEV